ASMCLPNLVFQGVGEVSASDVAVAAAARAKILAFRVQASGAVRDEAASQNVALHSFDVFYDLVDFVAADLSALLSPPLQGTRLGLATVKRVFKLSKAGRVAGCEVSEGSLRSTARVRVLRDRVVVFDGRVGGLKLLKDDVQEVSAGKECGVSIADFENVQERDILECYTV
ncbi:translation initiation factor IF-2, partial [archaeon]